VKTAKHIIKIVSQLGRPIVQLAELTAVMKFRRHQP